MCDCQRTIGNEYYWDSATRTCVLAKNYSNSCNFNYECKTLTNSLSCINGICDCNNGKFDPVAGVCLYCAVGLE